MKDKIIQGFKKVIEKAYDFNQFNIEKNDPSSSVIIIRYKIDDFTLTRMSGGARVARVANINYRMFGSKITDEECSELSKLYNDKYSELEEKQKEKDLKMLDFIISSKFN